MDQGTPAAARIISREQMTGSFSAVCPLHLAARSRTKKGRSHAAPGAAAQICRARACKNLSAHTHALTTQLPGMPAARRTWLDEALPRATAGVPLRETQDDTNTVRSHRTPRRHQASALPQCATCMHCHHHATRYRAHHPTSSPSTLTRSCLCRQHHNAGAAQTPTAAIQPCFSACVIPLTTCSCRGFGRQSRHVVVGLLLLLYTRDAPRCTQQQQRPSAAPLPWE